ncbi:MAG: CHASE2 domain-containing protein [Sphingosinicella sp.]
MDAWRERLRNIYRQVGPVRLLGTLLFLLLAGAIALFSWGTPFASDVERALYDLRVDRLAEQTLAQDQRITLVTYNDETLRELGKRSPLDRRMLARALAAIDAMGARAIGVDIIVDQAQPEDAELIAALRRMRTPTFLAFATHRHNPDQVEYWQEQFLRAFFRRLAGSRVRPASIRLEVDRADGVIRRWPRQDGSLPPLLANALSREAHPEFARYDRSILFKLPGTGEADEVPVFTNLPIQFVAEMGPALRDMFAGRYVLIGADIRDYDDYETPMARFSGRLMKGLEVHAQMLAQQLDGRMPPAIPGWALAIAAVAVVLAGMLTAAVELRGWRLALALAVELGAIFGLPFLVHAAGFDTIELPAFGWAAGWLLAFIGVGTAARSIGAEQRRFAHSALGKYLPPDIAAQIIEDPAQLALHGEKRPIFALFADLEGFTELSHAITPEQLSDLLNRYLDLMSDTVLRHGGTIDKFVGDAVVAFWGAPIARDDDGDRAVRAALDMFAAGETFRAGLAAGLPPVGRTRVGLHWGEAVVGNFGGKGRIQYTALGDTMNTASRLESANKALKTRILVSEEARARTRLELFRPMGRVVVSGRSTPVETWEALPGLDPGEAQRLAALWRRYDGGDRAALAELESIAAANEEDAALAFFVYRIGIARPGGRFVLETK